MKHWFHYPLSFQKFFFLFLSLSGFSGSFLLGLDAKTPEKASLIVASHIKSEIITLKEVAKKMGLKYETQLSLKQVRLFSPKTEINFKINKKEIQLNGVKVFLGEPVQLKGIDLGISSRDFEETLVPLLMPQLCAGAFRPSVRHIMIDPGHGGKDQGAENKPLMVKEKDLVLKLGLKLQKILEDKGFKVSLTRMKDQDLKLRDRPLLAKQKKPDLFISLHLNAAAAQTASGVETYALTPLGQPSTARNKVDPEDLLIAKGQAHLLASTCLSYAVQASLVKRLEAVDRGCRRARFIVLSELDQCPGILVEGGFLSHPDEAKRLATDAYLNDMAEAIAQGVMRYQQGVQQLRDFQLAP
jgi:N-acetylmuramoyl-L-alanine amidase